MNSALEETLTEELVYRLQDSELRDCLIWFYGRKKYIDALYDLMKNKNIEFANVTLPLKNIILQKVFDKLWAAEFGEEGELLSYKQAYESNNIIPAFFMLRGFHIYINEYCTYLVKYIK